MVIILGLKFDTELAEMWLNAEFSNFLNKIAAQEQIFKTCRNSNIRSPDFFENPIKLTTPAHIIDFLLTSNSHQTVGFGMKQADKNIINSIGWIWQPNDRKDLILEEIEKQISRMNLTSKDTKLKSKCLIRSSLKIHLKNGGHHGKQFLDFINSNENQSDDADRAQSTSPVDMITERNDVQIFHFDLDLLTI